MPLQRASARVPSRGLRRRLRRGLRRKDPWGSRAIVTASYSDRLALRENHHGEDDEDLDARSDRSVHAVVSGRGRDPEEDASPCQALVARGVRRGGHDDEKASAEGEGRRSIAHEGWCDPEIDHPKTHAPTTTDQAPVAGLASRGG